MKIVCWDGSGVCLFAKRLEKPSFCWPRIGPVRVQLNHAQLMALLDGLDWKMGAARGGESPCICWLIGSGKVNHPGPECRSAEACPNGMCYPLRYADR